MRVREMEAKVSLQTWMYLGGGLLVAAGAIAWATPNQTAARLRAFPRSRTAAWLLSGAAVAWSAWVIRSSEMGWFPVLHPWILPASVAGWVLMNFFMDELLAPRALGGLLLLAADGWLAAVRMHPSGWSRAPAVLAYVLVLAGMALVLSPHLFRRTLAPVLAPASRLRGVAAGVAVLGSLWVWMGFTVLG